MSGEERLQRQNFNFTHQPSSLTPKIHILVSDSLGPLNPPLDDSLDVLDERKGIAICRRELRNQDQSRVKSAAPVSAPLPRGLGCRGRQRERSDGPHHTTVQHIAKPQVVE